MFFHARLHIWPLLDHYDDHLVDGSRGGTSAVEIKPDAAEAYAKVDMMSV
jgi:hypothetical protein